MVYALSKIFRLTLNHGDSMTTVKNEKEFIESYVLLQTIRLKERLKCSIAIEDSLLPLPMPKLTLQPFVENAIVHVAEQRTTTTQISISGVYRDGYLQFTVTDDGDDIDEDLLQQLNDKDSHANGYAIGNIRERLELCYGSNFTLAITSKPGLGTTVLICIPAEGKR